MNRSIPHRICDIDYPSKETDEFDSISGFNSVPIVSIDEALRPVEIYLPNIQNDLNIVKRKCQNSIDNLSRDELSSLMIYTMGTSRPEDCLYYVLNKHLRCKDRQVLTRWFLYLKLLLTSLSRLPSNPCRTIYRGIKKDFHDDYLNKSKIIWWSFTSCTDSLNTLQSDLFLGQTGQRTLFTIETDSSIDISKYSFYPDENELLLLPGREFHLQGYLYQSSGLHLIQLKEIPSDRILLEPIVVECFYPDGSEYKGEMRGGQRHGQGFYRFVNGEEYRGQWKDDQTNGKGCRIFPSGNRYEGEEKNGKRHGFGICSYSNGDSFQGQWIDDQINGFGIYRWKNHLSYRGNFENNQKHGKGQIHCPHGQIQIGSWIKDKKVSQV